MQTPGPDEQRDEPRGGLSPGVSTAMIVLAVLLLLVGLCVVVLVVAP